MESASAVLIYFLWSSMAFAAFLVLLVW